MDRGVLRHCCSGADRVKEVFEGYPDAEAVNTLTLSEKGGITTLPAHVPHKSREKRDGHVLSGMEAGMQLAMNRVESLLATIDGSANNNKENNP